jgi:hypothetical protein
MVATNSTPEPAPRPKKPRGSHRTSGPLLSRQDIKFARLLFDRGATKKTVLECYLEAGFAPRENDHATEMAAWRRVRNREFRAFYRQLQDDAAAAEQVTANRVVRGFARIAFGRRRDLYDEHNRLLPPSQWSDDLDATIDGIDTEDLFEVVSGPGSPKRKELVGYARKVRFAKRIEALKILAQILRLLGPDSTPEKPPPGPLVIGGGADPDLL